MRELRVIDITDSTIVAVDADGEEFRLTLDESQVTRIRSPRSDGMIIKASPREIQALIRAGLSPEDVSAVTGASLEDIERYEAPVLAEREFILNSALATPTLRSNESEPVPFGTHIRNRLESLGASDQRWVSWKDSESGWLVKVVFTVKGVEHDARWSFDSRRGHLEPVNSDATTLSSSGELDSGVVPKLRAVDVMTGAIPTVNDSQAHTRRIPTSPVFSEVSESIKTGAINIVTPEQRVAEPVSISSESPVAAVGEEPESMQSQERSSTPTADLLEALRKRRLQNDDAPVWLSDARVESTIVPESTVPNPVSEETLHAVAIERESTMSSPSIADDDDTAALNVSDAPPLDTSSLDGEPLTDTGRQRKARKTRPVLPAWDNIVFGRPADE